MKSRILITGGSGFIGTNLIEDLLREDQSCVLNLDHHAPLNTAHSRFWKPGDITDLANVVEAFASFAPTHVVHLAARTDLAETSQLQGYSSNITGTEYVLRAIASTPSVTRAIFTSSMLVCRLGYTPESDEDYAPDSLYGESKVAAEKLIRASALNCSWAIIRPTTIWGPWHLRMKNEFFKVLKKGYYFHPGGRSCIRSYGYVGNVVHQIKALLSAPDGQIHRKTFYVGDAPISLGDFVNGFSLRLCKKGVRTLPLSLFRWLGRTGDLAIKLGWKNPPLNSYRLSNMTADNIVDMSATLKLCGSGPFSLSQGIERTAQWLEQQ